jgi:uncharacterized protein YndB with AHSA1/START domain
MSKIQQEITLNATPERVYRALMNNEEHAKFTGGGAADISDKEGGPWSAHGGRIHGRNIELVENARIVQAWRSADWPEGVYSMVRFDLSAAGDKTTLRLEHDAVPDDKAEMIGGGWEMMYWGPLRKYLG